MGRKASSVPWTIPPLGPAAPMVSVGRASVGEKPTESLGNIGVGGRETAQGDVWPTKKGLAEFAGLNLLYSITMAVLGVGKPSRGGMGLDLGPERSLEDQRGRGAWKGRADCKDGMEEGPQGLRGKETERRFIKSRSVVPEEGLWRWAVIPEAWNWAVLPVGWRCRTMERKV